MDSKSLSNFIDQTWLKPADEAFLEQFCQLADEHQFYAVCVLPEALKFVAGQLKKSSVKAITVVDFPRGEASTDEKVRLAEVALSLGAKELDLVLDYKSLKTKNFIKCFHDIESVCRISRATPVKVILETSELSESEKAMACALVAAAGAQFVKTSTGFSSSGATQEDVQLLRTCVGKGLGVKASGGIRTRAQALAMIQAGASRIGTSQGVEILSDQISEKSSTGAGY